MANEDESAASTARPSSRWSRKWSIHPLALVAIVVASIAVGAFAVNAASSPEPAAPADGAHALTGTDRLAAAEQWLKRPATAEDVFPAVNDEPGLIPTSTRLVTGDQKFLKVWIGKTDKNELCLLGTENQSTASFSKCMTPDDFSKGGIPLTLPGYQVAWDGKSVTTTLTSDNG